jgi:polyisoprenoid-binding protein YceI
MAVCAAVQAGNSLSAVGESTVKFEASGPAGLKINGESTGIRVSEADGKVKLIAPTTQFHTGIGLRDKHLREAIEADKHPDTTLVVDKSAIKLPEGGTSSGKATGTLTLHGVARPTTFSYTITKKGDAYQVHGDLSVNIIEHQIKKPCYLGVCVGEVIKVTADLTVHGS